MRSWGAQSLPREGTWWVPKVKSEHTWHPGFLLPYTALLPSSTPHFRRVICPCSGTQGQPHLSVPVQHTEVYAGMDGAVLWKEGFATMKQRTKHLWTLQEPP